MAVGLTDYFKVMIYTNMIKSTRHVVLLPPTIYEGGGDLGGNLSRTSSSTCIISSQEHTIELTKRSVFPFAQRSCYVLLDDVPSAHIYIYKHT